MPYKDPEKRRAAARQSMAKRAAAKVTARQEKKENVAGGDAKALAWTFIVYPESAPKELEGSFGRVSHSLGLLSTS